MARTVAQVETDWITQGNIARLKYSLDAETDPGRRKWLEDLLREQQALIVTEIV